tara:strand:+ start:22425 stop:23351 length:927 start_codon:yes stop_codon:yes gene_type:complete
MGWLIDSLKKKLEFFANENIFFLRLGGFLITFILVISSGTFGWLIEQLSFSTNYIVSKIGLTVLLLLLASCIASKSLTKSCLSVIKPIESNSDELNLERAKANLSSIVGRDVKGLKKEDIFRAVAESASENSVDGIFAPIFWIIIGLFSWKFSHFFPGPLAFALIFKASSTLDSMLGYREGNLKWIGYSGAKLDDLLTWIPCRLVLITLPLISRSWHLAPGLIKNAWFDGSKDSSPNSGLSEAIFAHCLEIKMGGENFYQSKKVIKPILARKAPPADINSIKKILRAILRLKLTWVILLLILSIIMSI